MRVAAVFVLKFAHKLARFFEHLKLNILDIKSVHMTLKAANKANLDLCLGIFSTEKVGYSLLWDL